MMKSYIVVLKHNASRSDVDRIIAGVESAGGTVTERYNGGALNGFAAAIPHSHLQQLQASRKSGDSKISRIEPDGVMQIQE